MQHYYRPIHKENQSWYFGKEFYNLYNPNNWETNLPILCKPFEEYQKGNIELAKLCLEIWTWLQTDLDVLSVIIKKYENKIIDMSYDYSEYLRKTNFQDIFLY